MVSFQTQMNTHRAARIATGSLEASSRSQIREAFDSWDSSDLNAQTVRHRLESLVRSAYRVSASIAREVAQKNSDLPEWASAEVNSSDYLKDLIQDVRRNLRDYKSDLLTREAVISRISHSAGVASQRGYTDQLISSYSELEDLGMSVRKYWVANFIDNEPCDACLRLHGTSLPLKEDFRAEVGESGVYRDLQGPPRHPRCQCGLYVLVTTLENLTETPNFEHPEEARTVVTTKDIKRMSRGFFASIIASLVAILSFLRRR